MRQFRDNTGPSWGVAVSPDDSRLYITRARSTSPGSVAVIDTATYQVLIEIPVGSIPAGIAITHPDGSKPHSNVLPLPATEASANFPVQWSGTDDWGIMDYTIYASDNGGPFTLWLSHTRAVQAAFPGVAGHSYGFYSLARDFALNQEDPKLTADASTQIPSDGVKPISSVLPLAAVQSDAIFPVQWSGTDAGSGIRDYSVYASDNAGPFTPWLTQTTATRGTFAGTPGHAYGFYSIARDFGLNQEIAKTTAETTTSVTATAPDSAHVQPFVYVANYDSNSVSVIDAPSGAVIRTIPVGTHPDGVAISPDGSRAYVTNTDSASISVIDTAKHVVTGTVGVQPRPARITTPAHGMFGYYLTSLGSNDHPGLNDINLVTNHIDGGLADLGTAGGFQFEIPDGLLRGALATTPDGKRVFACIGDTALSVIDVTIRSRFPDASVNQRFFENCTGHRLSLPTASRYGLEFQP